MINPPAPTPPAASPPAAPVVPPDAPPPLARVAEGIRPPALPQRLPSRTGTFLAIFQKEARELAPWLGLCSAGMGVALALALYSYQRKIELSIGTEYSVGQIALPMSFFALTATLAPIAGGILGFLAFFREARPDRYAFLTHRPISRNALFAAKFSAGISLYLLAMALPIFIALLWAGNPHNIPLPFSWSMALAFLADILAGIPCFAAAALMASRKDARWYGSRLLPLAPVFVTSVLNFNVRTFFWAVLVAVPTALVLYMAAQGAFASAGQIRSQSRASKPFLGIVLYISIILACTAGIGMIDALIESLSPRESTRMNSIYNTATAFLKDGTPVTAEYDIRGNVRLVDLAGKNVGTYKDNTSIGIISMNTLRRSPQSYDPWEEMFHNEFSYFAEVAGYGANVHWYRPTAGDYLVGFDPKRKERIGAIGPRGFTPWAATPPERFAHPVVVLASGTPKVAFFVASGDTLYELSPDNTSFTSVYTLPNHETILKAGRVYDVVQSRSVGSWDQFYYPVLATADSVTILSSSAAGERPTVLAHYQGDRLDRQSISAGYVPEKKQFVLLLTPAPAAPGYTAVPRTAIYLNPGDGVEKTIALAPTTPLQAISFNSFHQYVEAALVPPVFVGLGLLVERLRPAPEPSPFVPPTNTADTFSAADRFMAHAAFLLTLPTLAAIAMHFLARRFRFHRSAAIAWIVATLILGPAGILLMFCFRGIPLRTACPNCQKLRPVHESHCLICDALFAQPATNGTEIFA